MAHRSFLTALRSAFAPLLAALLLGGTGCTHRPSDPKFHYNRANPLDDATVHIPATSEIPARVWRTIARLTGKDRSVEGVERALSDHGARCQRGNGPLRCTFGKAWILGMPSPIPFVEDRLEEHADLEITARRDASGRLFLEVCATTYTALTPAELQEARRKGLRQCTEGALKTGSRSP
jgi:hypothetical protein